MIKPKVGFMAVSCPTHVKATTETGEKWVDESLIDQLLDSLKGYNLEVMEYKNLIDSVSSSLEAVDKFKREDVDCMVVYIATWNWASQIMQAAREFGRPIILWALPRPSAWSIGGLAVTHGSFDEVGIPHRVVYGFPDEPEVKQQIVRYANAARVAAILKKSIYGSIGGQGMGIHSGIVDANQWLKDFGIGIGFTDQYTVVVEAEKMPKPEVEKVYKQLKEEYGEVPPLDEITERSIRLYLALEKIIEKEGYNFTGVKCTFDLSDNYCTACLAQSRLATRGFVSACLNDANAALTMYIMRQLTDEPIFMADVNLVDKKNRIVRLIDDGAGSINLAANPKKVRLSYQPRLEAKASGVCTGLICKPGEVTLARLARVKGRYVMQIARGEAFEGQKEWLRECGYPMWPHAFIHFKGDIDAFIQNLRSEYIHMAYGDLKDQLVEVCRVLEIEPIIT